MNGRPRRLEVHALAQTLAQHIAGALGGASAEARACDERVRAAREALQDVRKRVDTALRMLDSKMPPSVFYAQQRRMRRVQRLSVKARTTQRVKASATTT